MTMPTTREAVAMQLSAMVELQALGVAPEDIFDADAADNVDAAYFIVVRWLEEEPGMGAMTRRPFELWCYGPKGDRTQQERIGRTAVKGLTAIMPIAVEDGWLSQIYGGTRGRDLYDDGYEAAVVPYTLRAVSSGV